MHAHKSWYAINTEQLRAWACGELSSRTRRGDTKKGVRAHYFNSAYLLRFRRRFYDKHSQNESCGTYLRAEEQRWRGRCRPVSLRPEPDHLQMQDPAPGWADDHVSSGHEQLLQQVERAGAHATDQQKGKQGGDPTARYRLHLGLAGGVGRAWQETPELRFPNSSYDSERRACQHRSWGKYRIRDLFWTATTIYIKRWAFNEFKWLTMFLSFIAERMLGWPNHVSLSWCSRFHTNWRKASRRTTEVRWRDGPATSWRLELSGESHSSVVEEANFQ